MSFNRNRRGRTLGPRFGEIMGKHCHAAITASARRDRARYDKEVADIYQMLDTIEQETDWDGSKEQVQSPKVEPESERAAESAGSAGSPEEGTEPAEQPSKAARSTNRGKSGDGRSKRSGVASKSSNK